MSTKEITIRTVENNVLSLTAVRMIECRVQRQGFRVLSKTFTKRVVVQYGIGVGGEGPTLKAAVADFRKQWSDFCASRA